MLKKPVQNSQEKNYSKYGTFVNMLNPQTVKIRHHLLNFSRYGPTATGMPGGSVIFNLPRRKTSANRGYLNIIITAAEGTLPLDGDILIHVAPATAGELNTEDIEIFRVPREHFCNLAPRRMASCRVYLEY